MLIIAATATVIASGGYLRRLLSDSPCRASGVPVADAYYSHLGNGVRQIYIPFINWLLYISVVIVIVNFEHSSNLAAACGIAVTGTMVLTTILFTTVARQNWHWNKFVVALLLVCLYVH